MMARYLGLFIASLGLAACSNSAGPIAGHDVLFAIGGEGTSVFVIDPAQGTMLATPGPVPFDKGQPILSSDSSALLFIADNQTSAGVYALATRSYVLRRILDFGSPAAQRTFDGLWITGYFIGVAPDQPFLYLGGAYTVNPSQNPPLDDGRIAVLDTASQHVVSTIGPLDEYRGRAFLPPGPVAPHGALLVIGARLRAQAPSLSWLFVIDPVTNAIVDSAAVTPPNPGRGGTLSGVIAAPDGRRAFLKGMDGTLYGYDLVDRRIIGIAQLTSSSARLAITPDGTRVYAVDPDASSSMVQVFDATTVSALPPIELTALSALNGQIPVVHDIAVSRDGASLYLAAGTPHLLGDQSLHVLVMNRATGDITHVIPLGDWGTVALIVGR